MAFGVTFSHNRPNLCVTGSAPRSAGCLLLTHRLPGTSVHSGSHRAIFLGKLDLLKSTLLQDQRQHWRERRRSVAVEENGSRCLPRQRNCELSKISIPQLPSFQSDVGVLGRESRHGCRYAIPRSIPKMPMRQPGCRHGLRGPPGLISSSASTRDTCRSALASWADASTTTELSQKHQSLSTGLWTPRP